MSADISAEDAGISWKLSALVDRTAAEAAVSKLLWDDQRRGCVHLDGELAVPPPLNRTPQTQTAGTTPGGTP